MKYQVTSDNNKYVLSIGINADATLNTIEIEDISALDSHINAYKVVRNKLVLDEEKLAEIIAKEKEEAEKEEHEKEMSAQTLKLAEMFVDMGIDADTFLSRIDAQVLYSALMTDTLLEDEGEE